MAKSKVIVKDLGFNAVMKDLRKLNGIFITVGVQGDEGPREDGLSMALVASANEFGTATIPQRSFIRTGIDEGKKRIADVQQRALAQVMDRKLSPKAAAGITGLAAEDAIKRKITALQVPPNAPSTIAAKGSSNPLIASGQLRSAITHVVHQGRKPPKGRV